MIRIAALLAIAAWHGSASAQAPPEIAISREDRIKVFDKTWETVNKKFFDPQFNGVDWAAMKQKYRPLAEAAADKIELQAVLNNLLSELHVSHTHVSSGILFTSGISLIRLGLDDVVRLVRTDSPASSAGIKRGWVVRSRTGDCTAYGRKVTNLFQDLQGQPVKTELPCEILNGPGDPDVLASGMMSDNKTFYLRFPVFHKKSASWFEEQVKAHRSVLAMVIDLRGNSGGRTQDLLKCLNVFFQEKTEAVKFRRRNGHEVTYKVSGSGREAYSGQVFVLTDGESYSAAEIFASVMQETGRGVIVGRPTGGAVLGSIDFSLPKGFKLRLARYDCHTPKGTRLEGRGVMPDEPVEFTVTDFQQKKDPDILRVFAILAAKP